MKHAATVLWGLALASCNPVAAGLGSTGGAMAGSTGSNGTGVGSSGTPSPTSTSTSTASTTTPPPPPPPPLDSSGSPDTSTTGPEPGSSSGTTGGSSSGTTDGGSSSTGVMLDCETPMPSGQSLPVFDCACEPELMSMGGGQGSNVTFINNTGSPRRLYWIDFGGNRDLETQLPDGQSSDWGTSEFHPWIIADGAGTCIAIYMPQAGSHDLFVP